MIRSIALTALVFLAACGREEPASPTESKAAGADLSKFALAADPGQAISVFDAKKGDADTVVVVGRIQDVTKGYAAFKLIDTSLDYCGMGSSTDDCPTPWDYCCTPKDEIAAATLLVEAQDNGKIIKSKGLAGLRLLDLVVVKGKRVKDEHGNVRVLAEGWYRRERPELREGLRWPQ